MFLGRCSSAGYFENVLNWTGLCVEPNPEVFPRIASQAGRASGVKLAVSDTPGTLPFVAAYMRSSLNASAVDYAFLQSQGVVASSVEVRVTTPSLLLAGHRATRDVAVIDYVSVDVEQLELVFGDADGQDTTSNAIVHELDAVEQVVEIDARRVERVARGNVDDAPGEAPGTGCLEQLGQLVEGVAAGVLGLSRGHGSPLGDGARRRW
jgi:hypothetical protein